MSQVLHRCLTKATTAEGDRVRRGLHWLFSRRSILNVTTDSLICGDWVIPYHEITEAELLDLEGAMFPGHLLRVKRGSQTYQFGLNPNRFWQRQLPFQCNRDRARIGYSPFTFIVLGLLLAFLGFEFWTRVLGY